MAVAAQPRRRAVRCTVRHMFTYFFVTLGPVKIIGPFMHATANAGPPVRRAIAVRAFLISTVMVVLLAVAGDALAQRWGISDRSVSIAGGIILLVWSLRSLLGSSNPIGGPKPPEEPTLDLAAIPLTVPVIITPAGVAAILFFTMTTPPSDFMAEARIVWLLLIVMTLNLICMLTAKWILRAIGGRMTLQVIGGVLAVMQASLAVEVIIRSVARFR